MIQCPKCKELIPDDSWYCDQCGEQLMFCPKCKHPGKGKRCTQCGSLLLSGEDLKNGSIQPQPQSTFTPQTQQTQTFSPTMQQPQTPTSQPSAGGTIRPTVSGGTMRPQPVGPIKMVMVDDPSRTVVFKDGGLIGRTGGDYLNVFSDSGYTSGRHAQLAKTSDGGWTITDLGSTNGTKVDNRSITPNQPFKLSVGQIVEIGYKKFKVE